MCRREDLLQVPLRRIEQGKPDLDFSYARIGLGLAISQASGGNDEDILRKQEGNGALSGLTEVLHDV